MTAVDDESALPGEPASIWLDTSRETDYPRLDGDVSVDVAVIGGGIAGLTTAATLAESGSDVALVEADRIVRGVTARTTAKITSQHGLVYSNLIETMGEEDARRYAEANQAAIDAIATRVREEGIDCDFERLPAYAYADAPGEEEAIREEVRAARRLDLPASYVESPPLPFETSGAIRFDDQAHFHPRAYLLSLAETIVAHGGRVFEETRATDVTDGDPCEVTVGEGRHRVRADAVVVATHFPVVDRALYFARQYPKRSYVLAARLDGPQPDGMFYAPGDSYRSIHPHTVDGEAWLLVGGENHKTGQGGSTAERYHRLAQYVRSRFPVETIEYRWSTQDYVSVDRVPYVGRLGPGAEDVYVATGFGGWGMTGGTAAGLILSDLVRGRENPWADAFDPTRVNVRASARDFLETNADVAGRFASNWLARLRSENGVAFAPGEAGIVRTDEGPVAVYRDRSGEVHALSAVCSHMGCIVEWNDAERSWDCPCHGARYDYTGEVLVGPPDEGLTPVGAVPDRDRERD